MAKKYRSDAFAAIHETMEALHEVGVIEKKFDATMVASAAKV